MSSPVMPVLPAGPPPEPIKRLSVEQYHAIIRAGVFDDDDPIELLEGWLVEKMPKKPPHSVATGLVSDALAALLPPGWHLISQEPITTDDREPEPDIGAVRGKRRDYADRHRRPKVVEVIVEVADTTLARDRGVKKTIYARAGIPTYWIVNLVDRSLEVYADPTGPAKKLDYRQEQIYGPKDSAVLVLDGEEIGRLKVKLLLP
jgi:Uma2 family endonuclease